MLSDERGTPVGAYGLAEGPYTVEGYLVHKKAFRDGPASGENISLLCWGGVKYDPLATLKGVVPH